MAWAAAGALREGGGRAWEDDAVELRCGLVFWMMRGILDDVAWEG